MAAVAADVLVNRHTFSLPRPWTRIAAVDTNDVEALRAAYRGVKSTASQLGQMDVAVEQATHSSLDQPPADLIRAATAHAIAAAAFSGLLHRLFTPGGVAPKTMELTDSSGESSS